MRIYLRNSKQFAFILAKFLNSLSLGQEIVAIFYNWDNPNERGTMPWQIKKKAMDFFLFANTQDKYLLSVFFSQTMEAKT